MIPPCVRVDAMKHTSSEIYASFSIIGHMNKSAVSRRIVKNTA